MVDSIATERSERRPNQLTRSKIRSQKRSRKPRVLKNPFYEGAGDRRRGADSTTHLAVAGMVGGAPLCTKLQHPSPGIEV